MKHFYGLMATLSTRNCELMRILTVATYMLLCSPGGRGGFDTPPAPKLRISFLSSYDAGKPENHFLSVFGGI